MTLTRDEAIASQDILDMLGIAIGGLIEVKYDLLAMMPQSLAPFEQVIFEYKPQPGGLSKGELFLEMIDADHKLVLKDIFN